MTVNETHALTGLHDNRVADIPLDKLDMSKPSMFRDDTWRPLFARLRREAPLHYLADSDNGPFWSATTHEMILAVDANHEAFSSQAGGISIIDAGADDQLSKAASIITLDEPEHARQRKTVSPAVGPTYLEELEPVIRERAADILDHLPVGETFNWVDKVSVELTARMLATLLDFPYERRRDLIRWSDIATAVPKVTGEDIDMKERSAALIDCAMTFHGIWQERAAKEPRSDFISLLAHGEATKHHINDPLMMLGNIIVLIVGGNDTTRNSISGGVLALNQHPEEYEKLRADPGLIPNMVSEVIRWQTPVIHMRRTALDDVELGGKTIRKGDKVIMWYLSGNRDEAVFPDADRLIIDRPNARRHLAFGFGVHRCMGNRLAEMQLRVLWEEIMKRFKMVEVVGDVERISNNFIRGIATLPVRVHPY